MNKEQSITSGTTGATIDDLTETRKASGLDKVARDETLLRRTKLYNNPKAATRRPRSVTRSNWTSLLGLLEVPSRIDGAGYEGIPLRVPEAYRHDISQHDPSFVSTDFWDLEEASFPYIYYVSIWKFESVGVKQPSNYLCAADRPLYGMATESSGTGKLAATIRGGDEEGPREKLGPVTPILEPEQHVSQFTYCTRLQNAFEEWAELAATRRNPRHGPCNTGSTLQHIFQDSWYNSYPKNLRDLHWLDTSTEGDTNIASDNLQTLAPFSGDEPPKDAGVRAEGLETLGSDSAGNEQALSALGYPSLCDSDVSKVQRSCNIPHTCIGDPEYTSQPSGMDDRNISTCTPADIDSASSQQYSESEMDDYEDSRDVPEWTPIWTPVSGAEGHPFQSAVHELVTELLSEYESWKILEYMGGSYQSSSEKGAQIYSLNGGRSVTKPTGKRKALDHDEDSHDGNGNEDHKRRKPNNQESSSKGVRFSLTYPFAKKDPIKYRHCYSKLITKIQYVKQHLYRHHQIPIFCPRCKGEFSTDNFLREHAESDIVCTPNFADIPEGVSKEQSERLARRVSPKMTLEAQWYSIFEILFPGCQLPASPYVNKDHTVELRGFTDMMRTTGRQLIVRRLEELGLQDASSNEERDLSTLYSEIISTALEEISQRWTLGEEDNSHTATNAALGPSRRGLDPPTAVNSS